jgi:hypothetical protein
MSASNGASSKQRSQRHGRGCLLLGAGLLLAACSSASTGTFPLKGVTVATSSARGDTTQAQQAAAGAVKIVEGLPQATGSGAAALSPQDQAALTRLMTKYQFDLAFSANGVTRTGTTKFGSDWGIELAKPQEQNLIRQALPSPRAFGAFLAEVRADIGTASVIAVRTGDTQPLDDESALAGLLLSAGNGLHFSTAEQAAAAAAEQQQMACILHSGLGAVPGFGPGAGLVQGPVNAANIVSALSAPVIASSRSCASKPAWAIPDSADAADFSGSAGVSGLEALIWIPIANALIASHIVSPPPPSQAAAAWVTGQLAQNVGQADTAEVDELQAELPGSSPQAQAQINVKIDQLTDQVGNAQDLFDNLINQARSFIGDHG